MKKFLKILLAFFAVAVIFVALIQFTGFSIGNVQIGKQKDDLKSHNVSSLDGSRFKADVLDTSALTCVNIWATWCVPCIAEMPDLNAISKDFEGREIQFVSLSIDKDASALKRFLASGKFDFRDVTLENVKFKQAILNFLEGRPLDREIASQVVPLTYLIKNGKIVMRIEGGIDARELRNQIESHLPKR